MQSTRFLVDTFIIQLEVKLSKKSLSKLLTEVELEVMCILWKLNEGTVREVLSQLPEERKLAYTTASTILRILEQKKIVMSRKEGKSHIYIPILEKNKYEENTLHHVVNNLFNGTPSNLIKRLVTDQNLSDLQKSEIKKLLQEL